MLYDIRILAIYALTYTEIVLIGLAIAQVAVQVIAFVVAFLTLGLRGATRGVSRFAASAHARMFHRGSREIPKDDRRHPPPGHRKFKGVERSRFRRGR